MGVFRRDVFRARQGQEKVNGRLTVLDNSLVAQLLQLFNLRDRMLAIGT